jgi:hypothetical protein
VWIDYCLSECGWLCGLRGFVHDVDLAGAPPTLPRTTAEYFTVGRSLRRTPHALGAGWLVSRWNASAGLPILDQKLIRTAACVCDRVWASLVGAARAGSGTITPKSHAGPAWPSRTSSVPTAESSLQVSAAIIPHRMLPSGVDMSSPNHMRRDGYSAVQAPGGEYQDEITAVSPGGEPISHPRP